MRDHPKRTVFAPAFLRQLEARDPDGFSAAHAALSGPWQVERLTDERYAVLRPYDDPDQAEGLFRFKETALLAAAVLPALGSNCRYALDGSEDPEGHRLSRTAGENGFVPAGWLRFVRKDLARALHLVEFLLSTPTSLALVLEAASHDVMEPSGRLLAERLGLGEQG